MSSSDSISGFKADSSASGNTNAAPVETLGKDEAAQFLGVSSRALERYTASGRVAVGYAPGKTRSVAVYERAELEKLKSELQRPLLRGASVATSAASSVAAGASQQTPTRTPTTSTRTPTNPTQAAQSPADDDKVWGGQTTIGTSTNPDSLSDPLSDELVAVSPETSAGGENALDALTQLVLERLLERLQGEAGIAVASGSIGAGSTASGSTASGSTALGSTALGSTALGSTALASTALVLAPVGFVSKVPHVALAEKPLLTLPEAAVLTGLSRAFLKNAIAGGTLVAKPIGRLWRVKRADLDAFIAAL